MGGKDDLVKGTACASIRWLQGAVRAAGAGWGRDELELADLCRTSVALESSWELCEFFLHVCSLVLFIQARAGPKCGLVW